MPSYVLKILVDIQANDDLAARQAVSEMIQQSARSLPGVRDIVLHSSDDHKSIRVNPDGTFEGQWNRGGTGAPPGPKA